MSVIASNEWVVGPYSGVFYVVVRAWGDDFVLSDKSVQGEVKVFRGTPDLMRQRSIAVLRVPACSDRLTCMQNGLILGKSWVAQLQRIR